MVQHLLVYTKSITGSLQRVTWLQDPALSPDVNGNPILPQQMYLLWAFVGGTNLSQAELNVPVLRVPFLPSIWPLGSSDTLPNDPNVADYREQASRRPTKLS